MDASSCLDAGVTSVSGDAPICDLIFPPTELRGVIEKTAQFVAKNGVEFEQRVLRDQNQKFSFLYPTNPYHTFYQLKVREFKTGQEAPKPQVPSAIQDIRRREEEENAKKEQLLMLTQLGEKELSRKKVEPPPPDVFSVTQPFVASIDVDIIQTTAQFVARNGQRFLAGLSQREKQNPQFEFLKPSHALFSYFTDLVDAYTRCLLPPKEQLERLRETCGSHSTVLNRIVRRFLWEADRERLRQEKEDKTAEERAAMLSLEWHNFHLVETIDFTEEDENIPLAAPIDFKSAVREPPKSLVSDEGDGDESIAVLIKDVAAGAEDDEMDTEDDAAGPTNDNPRVEQEEIATDVGAVSANESPPPTEPPKVPIKIVKGYVRQRKRGTTFADVQGMQRCPITGQLVRASEMSNHLRVLLLDPKWKQQKERFLEKARAESAFAPMEDVEGNLALFVSRRPDLFGSVDDQVTVEDGNSCTQTLGTGKPSPVNTLYDPAAAPAGVSTPLEPAAKKQRGEHILHTSELNSVILTIVCVAGGGLDAQELQVEVEESTTVASLKASLIEAGLGSEELAPSKLILKDISSGLIMHDTSPLHAYGIRTKDRNGARVQLAVLR